MSSINFWSKLALYWQKITLVIIAVFSAACLSAQDASFNKGHQFGDRNLPNYDDKILHYGFTLGLNSTRLKPTPSLNYVNPQDSIISITAPRTTGFTLGFILNVKIGPFFDLRLLPTVAFYQRDLNFVFAKNFTSSQIAESTFIEIPLLCKYKSERHGNTRMYLIGGLKGAIEAGAKKKEKKETDLRTNNVDLSIDYGFGFDIYYPLFKFSPELRFSHGLLNMINKDNNIYATSMKRAVTHTITLYLHFE